MKILDLTLPSPQENLTLDDTLLEECEKNKNCETLRFWESPTVFAVLGYSNKIESEINELSCQERQIPILRRSSGGGTVLQGPGCLNFSLILRMERSPHFRGIQSTNTFIMEQHRQAIESVVGKPIEVRGITDLAIKGLKFSGNAQRRKRDAFLFHGTFLHDFDLPLIEKFLSMPSKQPCYRQNRPHTQFLTNLKIPPAKIKQALTDCWQSSRGDVV
jgi:lipoate-protein ligase A